MARPMHFVAPYFSIADGDSATLYLMNATAFPQTLDIAAVSPDGETLALGQYLAEPQRHLAVDLTAVIPENQPEFHRGSLSVRLLGDPQALAGWVVLRRGIQTLEVPLSSAAKTPGELLSFWSPTPGAEARYHLLNSGEVPVAYRVELGRGGETLARKNGHLMPGERQTLRPAVVAGSAEGWIRVKPRGKAGSLTVFGMIEGADHLARLPWAAPADLEKGTAQDAIRLPDLESAILSVFQPRAGSAPIELDLVDLMSGSLLARGTVEPEPGVPVSVVLGELFPVSPSRETRLRLRGSEPFLVSGCSRLPAGEVVDLAFFPTANAHPSGLYPLPGLEGHEVVTTLVNLGDEPAQIGAQVSWNGGTRAIGPFEVPAGGAHRLDFATIAEAGEADVLGRTLDPAYEEGFLQWTVIRGSRQLIARTEARPRDGHDAFGFNCFTCCESIPRGVTVPGSISFAPGQTPSFQSCMMFEQCSGSSGPYYVPPQTVTAPSPFTWNGQNVGASGGGSKILSFTAEGLEFKADCTSSSLIFPGEGDADTCKAQCNPNFPLQTQCKNQTGNCTTCFACCNAQFGELFCRTEQFNSAQRIYNECVLLCKQSFGCGNPPAPPSVCP